MRRDNSFFILKIFLAYIFAVAFPVAAKFVFNSNISLLFIIGLAVIKPTLILLGSISPKDIRRVFVVISSLFSILYVTVISIGIIITPASAYKILFKAMQTSFFAPGQVSNLFVFFIGFFSSTFGSVLIERDIMGPLAGIMIIIATIAAMIFQNPILYVPFLALVVFAFAYTAISTLDKGYRLRSVIASCIILALGGGLGYWIYNSIEVQGSKEIDELSKGMRAGVSKVFPSIPLLYELPEFGFSFEDEFKKPLGATPVLSDVPILEVDANPGDKIIYLRSRIHTTLSASLIWETPAYDELEQKVKRRSQKDEEKPLIEVPDFIKISDAPKAQNEIAVQVLGEYFTNIPTTLDTSSIRLKSERPSIIFGNLDKGFYLDKDNPLFAGNTVYLARGEKPLEPPPDMKEYLQVPGFLSDRIKNLAKSYASYGSKLDILNKIQKDLAAKYTYNLETGEVKKGENFLDKFLFVTKEGYSIHFASALIVLARLNGIPARYVSGFLVCIPQPKVGSQTPFFGFNKVLTGLSAHVWPEIWFPGEGWKTVEATAAVLPESYNRTADGLVYGKSLAMNQYTRKQLKGLLGEAVVEEKIKITENPIPVLHIDPIVFVFIAIPIVLILLWIRYYYIIRYAFAKNRATLNYLGRKIVRKHKRSAVMEPGDGGWIRWGEDLKARTSSHHAQRIDAFTSLIMVIAYSGEGIDKRDVKAVFTFYRKVGAAKKIKERAEK
jgi:hypothetical protein